MTPVSTGANSIRHGTTRRQPGRPDARSRVRRLLTALSKTAGRAKSDLPLVVLDAVLVVFAYVVAFAVRFDLAVPGSSWRPFRGFLVVVLVVHLVSNWLYGLYRQMWRHASVSEAGRVLASSFTAGGVLAVTGILRLTTTPLSVRVLGMVLVAGLQGFVRFQSRLFSVRQARSNESSRSRVLVVGAGEAGAALIRDIGRSQTRDFHPVAVVDDNPRTQGRNLLGVPVVGPVSALEDVARRYCATSVVLAMPSATAETVRRVAEAAERAALPLKVLPPVREILSGRVSVRDVRDLRIEDLLGRAQVDTDLRPVSRLLAGKRVLITGAGGSIGSEIARQVSAFEPELVLMLDHDETHLHDAAPHIRGNVVQLLVDIRDGARLRRLFRRWHPQVVFHAAALKHVPVLEAHPSEAVHTNLVGTANVVDAAEEVGVECLVFISTDKAVRPSSVMGASKRIGEQIVLSHTGDDGRYCAVRFGNVLGSRGSVVPTFARQIADGGPVTVTDPRMTRYFMAIPEAVQLVLCASALAEGGDILMLEMGEPCNIFDLAKRMIRLSGHEVGHGIPVRFTGMRAGEKLHEELAEPDEFPEPTAHPAIVRVRPPFTTARQVDVLVRELAARAAEGDDKEVAALLFEAANAPVTPEVVVLGDGQRMSADHLLGSHSVERRAGHDRRLESARGNPRGTGIGAGQ